MEDNKDTNTETEVKNNAESNGGDGTDANSVTADTKDNAKETVTMSKSNYDKAIQSAEDKVRGKLSKQIRDLEAKVKELSPVEKTQAEIDIEDRLAALEASEKAVAERERKIAVQEKLSANGFDKALSDYIKDDADVDKLSALVDGIVKSRMKANGYVPENHPTGDNITVEQFKAMPYDERAELYTKNPALYQKLSKKVR